MPTSPASIVHGPGLIGIFLNLILYGAVTVQIFYYYTRYPKDKLWIKSFVALLFVADTVNSVFDMWWIYDVLVTNWGDADALLVGNWRTPLTRFRNTDPATTGIIAALVQGFFCWRIWMLTRNKLVVGFIAFATICCGFGILKEWVILQKGVSILVVWLAGGAIADIGITIVLTWHLLRHSKNFTQQSDPLTRLVRLTISNGLITTLFNLADIIAFVASTGGIHLLFNFPLAKLYTNSVMATLNQRESTVEELAVSFKTPTAKLLGSNSRSVRPSNNDGGVTVTVERHEMVDMSTDSKRDTEWELSSGSKGYRGV